MPKSTLCLNMIVKNEARVLVRCFDSVARFIDRWVIVDTGSTDGTQELIRRYFAERGLEGTLHERLWRDFGSNRNEALELARGRAEYVLIIDADEVLESSTPEFRLPPLTAGAYQIKTELGGISYYRTQIVQDRLPWRWTGVLHEYLECGTPFVQEKLEGLVNRPQTDGARSADPRKYENDAQLLERALSVEPDNTRYAFYLAQSYRDAGRLDQALAAYRQRAAMGGWAEESFYAAYQVGRLLERLGRHDEALVGYLRAFEARPTRAEPLYELSRMLRSEKSFALARLFAKRACTIPLPSDLLFVDESVYRWRALDEFAVASYWTADYADAKASCERLLAEGHVPEEHRERVRKNLEFSRSRLGPPAPTRS